MSLGTATFGRWHHVALRYNRASLVLDGLLDGVPCPPAIGDRASPTEGGYRFLLAFGLADSNYMGSGGFLPGEVDEIRVWNGARTDAEIRENRMARLGGDESGLVAYWRLDEGSGSVLTDSSGHGNTAGFVPEGAWGPSGIPQEYLLAPFTTGLAASTVGSNITALQARVNPRGLITSARFEYGLDLEDPFTTASMVVRPEDGETVVTAEVADLVPGEEYRYRIRATNDLGVWVSEESVFRAAPPAAQKAIILDGRDDFIATPNLTSWFPSETMTIELWFNAAAAGLLLDERGQPVPAAGWQASLLEVLSTGEGRPWTAVVSHG